MPAVGKAFQLVLARVFEREPRPGDEVLHGAGRQDLGRARRARRPERPARPRSRRPSHRSSAPPRYALPLATRARDCERRSRPRARSGPRGRGRRTWRRSRRQPCPSPCLGTARGGRARYGGVVPPARAHARSPAVEAATVDPTMSVNSTVARYRSSSTSSRWIVVTNRSTSAGKSSPTSHMWTSPGSSASSAPGMWSARYRPCSIETVRSSRRWMISVGTRIDGRRYRRSSSRSTRSPDRSVPRSTEAALERHHVFDLQPVVASARVQGFHAFLRELVGGPGSLGGCDLCVGLLPREAERVVGRPELPSLGAVGHEAGGAFRERGGEHRSDRETGVSSPSRVARAESTASMTARTSSIRLSRVSCCSLSSTWSDNPLPRLSRRINRLNDASRRRKSPDRRPRQIVPRPRPPMTSTRSTAPSPAT